MKINATGGSIKRASVTAGNTETALMCGELPVLAMPALVLLMEQAINKVASESIDGALTSHAEDFRLKLMRTTAIGSEVMVSANLIRQEKERLTFELEAFDEKGKIAEAFEVRRIVDFSDILKDAKAGTEGK